MEAYGGVCVLCCADRSGSELARISVDGRGRESRGFLYGVKKCWRSFPSPRRR